MGVTLHCFAPGTCHTQLRSEYISVAISLKRDACHISLCLQVFVGDKYGAAQLPPDMTLEDFEALRKALQDASCDATLLEEWYLQDDNDDAQQYFLKPATSLSGEYK